MEFLETRTLRELLALRVSIDVEIARRGHSRTFTSLAGELMERVVADAFRGQLASVGAASIDVIAEDGRRIQVKTRAVPKGDLRHWALSDFKFDAIALIAFDRDAAKIDWARELTAAQAMDLARPHVKDGWRIRMGRARNSGRDITSELQIAFANLR